MTTRSKIPTASSTRPSTGRKRSSENTRGSRGKSDDFSPKSSCGRTLVKRVRNTEPREGLPPRDGSVLIAVSGGPDSVALLHILLSLRTKLGLRLGVVHVNYRLRGGDSDRDERLVHEYCLKFGLPCFTYTPRNTRGRNEEALRDLRYRFFERIRVREGFDAVATAHTEDDQAETVLIRLLRGTGPEGLSGIRAKNGRIIRPLLGVTKRDLLDFLVAERIRFREDLTNLDTSILRNRIRHELLPLLEREYRHGIRKILARTARIFEENETAGRDGSGRLHETDIRDGIAFSREAYLRMPAATRAAELRRLYKAVSGSGKNPGASFVREADRLIASTKSKIRTAVSARLKIEARGDKVSMLRNKQ